MHKFLRAVGFSNIKSRKEMGNLVSDIVASAKGRKYTGIEENIIYAEYMEEFAEDLGIIVTGSYEEDNLFIYDHYFPYLKSNIVSSGEDVTIERHKEHESYSGICDDARVGVTLIFYLQNVVDYIKIKNSNLLPVRGTSVNLTALSRSGKIMMPIIKEKVQAKKAAKERKDLIDAARRGDSNAIDSLTLDDMETYAVISEKIKDEDVYSLVNSYLMPYGVECDLYSMMGEILSCDICENRLTKEKIWKLEILCKDMHILLCINEQDLLGEPQVGRRFKGVIWLQGYINYPYNLD